MPADPIKFQDQGNIVANFLELVRVVKALVKRFLVCEAQVLGLDHPEVDPALKDLPAQVHALEEKIAKLQAKMDTVLPDGVDPTIPPDAEPNQCPAPEAA